MVSWHSETTNRLTFEVEFDQNHRFIADDPTVVAGLDGHDLRSFVLHDTAIGILDMDFASGEKPDVGMHAEVGAHHRFHIDRPAEPRRVDHALDAGSARASHLQPNMADFTELGTSDGREKRIRCC
jgi:hypothetical protein